MRADERNIQRTMGNNASNPTYIFHQTTGRLPLGEDETQGEEYALTAMNLLGDA